MPGKSVNKQACSTCILLVSFIVGTLLLIHPLTATAGDPVVGSEYDVKIGFIYNFVKFVTWPPEAFEKSQDTLTLCLASDSAIFDAFSKLEGKVIKGRKIKIVAYQKDSCLDQSHIIFFANQDKNFIQQTLNLTRGRPILTIGQIEGFTQWGGIINFFEESNRLRFRVNIDAAEREGLKMSSQLLGSAQIVHEEHH